MHIKSLLVLSLVCVGFAAVNEPCYGANNQEGVCVTTSDCSASGGTYISGACPSDPSNVKCCSKPKCSIGRCRWTSDCAGSTKSGECPGPDQFKCCSAMTDAGYGGYGPPNTLTVGSCKSVSVAGAKAVVAAWPGRVREIGCYRPCTTDWSSDHCYGKAIDLMCSDAGGSGTLSGNYIAEWVMNHHDSLNVKYVIWGQRIWEASKSAPKHWSQWTPMEDRDSITQNHWDHVHVSFY